MKGVRLGFNQMFTHESYILECIRVTFKIKDQEFPGTKERSLPFQTHFHYQTIQKLCKLPKI